MTQLKYHKYQQDNLAKGFRVTQVDIVSCIYRKVYEERNRQQKLESTPKCHSKMPLYGSTPRLHSMTPLHKLHSADFNATLVCTRKSNNFGHYYTYLAAALKTIIKVCAPSGDSDKLCLSFLQSHGCVYQDVFYSVM